MEEIVTILSTREWAIAIWGTGFFVWMLTQREIRKSLWNVIKILLGKNLRHFFLIIALYVAGITMIFYQFKEMDKKKLTLKMQIQQEYYRVKELLDGKWPSRMDLFTYMDDEIYRICVSGSHAKENPFQHYLDFLYELGELSEDEQKLYAGIGREFIQTIETTEMQKVYKMPILYSFYNHGNIRLAVTDEEVLESWKEFFDTGTNWKDFPNVNTYEDYKKVTDKQHLSKAKRMPIRFLKASGKGFFVEKDGYALALRDEIGDVVGNVAFAEQMGDVLEYRSLEYYRRRYEKE